MIQIDMQMPERCGVCFAMHTDEIGLESWCGIDETARDIYTEEINTKRPDWCPLKEQEAVEPKQVDLYGNDEWWGLVCVCPDCNAEWMTDKANTHFCPNCGRSVKWE